MRDLRELRDEIDRIDRQLLPLFIERMELCGAVADYKKENGLPVLDAAREKQVLKEKQALLTKPGYDEAVYEFFSSVMAISRGLQAKKIKDVKKEEEFHAYFTRLRDRVAHPAICYFGTKGSYSEAAAIRYFSEGETRFCADSFEGAFAALAEQRADYAVVPIENSSTGAIAEVMDLLERCGCYMVGEVHLPICHCLLAKAGTAVGDIKTVYSHEQGLLQSKDYLKSLGDVRQEVCCSTAMSARMVAENDDPTVAAIAGRQNAALYGLTVLKENVNTSAQNTTRFAVVAKRPENSAACNKISIAFTLAHECGELYRVLSCFVRGGLNLLKLESRPIPNQPFSYMFFVDYSGNLSDPHVRSVTEAVIAETQRFKLLGNYPAGSVKEPEQS